MKEIILCGLIMAIGVASMARGLGFTPAEGTYDVVIANGRVMDPGTNLDATRNVGINGGRIAAISEKSLQGKTTIDAKGLVVAPGFIDMHEHGQQPRNYLFQLRDGVTTTLELELGTADVNKWYADREGKTPINFGVSIGHIPVRMALFHDSSTFLPTGEAAHSAATPEEISLMSKAIEKGFREGALAEGMGINYTPGASHWEIVEMFKAAAKFGAPVHVHLRFGGIKEPDSGLAALEEVISVAAATGTPLHVVHITSMGLKDTPQLIALVEGAQHHGLDVTTECYPYTAASTGLESAIFDPGWQENLGITYKDLQWAATGERLTAETFAKYRKQGGIVVIHAIPAEAARAAVANPMVMIASDGMIITGTKVHPRGQGTFARVLGHYVREEHALDLMTALRKMSYMQALRLEKRSPMFKRKGRLQVGADADITVFDAAHVIDKATYEDPLQYSEGIEYVLVNGVPIVKNEKIVDGLFPGKPARAPISQ